MHNAINDVVLCNEHRPAFVVNSAALRTLDIMTKGDPKLRRHITRVMSKTMRVLSEFSKMPNKELAFQSFKFWWNDRQRHRRKYDNPNVGTHMDNHVFTMAKEMIGIHLR